MTHPHEVSGNGPCLPKWCVSQSSLHPFQDGETAVLLASRFGHKGLVKELCETFGADILHRMKVRAMQTISGSEWLSELCMYPIIMCGCTLRITVSQP